MTLAISLLAALGLDLFAGDPRWSVHPVRLMGRAAAWLEPRLRRAVPWPRLAGALAVVAIVGGAGGLAGGIVWAAQYAHPVAGIALAAALLFFTIAVRDMVVHSQEVAGPLARAELPAARTAVGKIVGRDTAALDAGGITRAAVESVAENFTDGVSGALFWALVGGLAGGLAGAAAAAMAFRAANVLDATYGHKNERYRLFGWAGARLDDALGFLPARLGVLAVAGGALFAGERPWRALVTAWRDRKKHASPNAALAEAAFAGALGVALGGPAAYAGVVHDHPVLGDAREPIAPAHIARANRLLVAGALVFTCACAGVAVAWGCVR